MLDKFFHSINIVSTLYLISRNVDFRNFILQLSYYKNNFQPQKFSLYICQYTNLLVQITLRMGENCTPKPLMLDKFFHSINIVDTLYLISRNVDFRNFILQLSYYKNNFQPQKFSLDICQYTNLLVQITLRMVFTKRNSLK